MRLTLRRSCAACARAKHSCDLQTPKCSRCVKRNASCVYANEPLTSGNAAASRAASARVSQEIPSPERSRSLDGVVTVVNTSSRSSSDAPALSMAVDALFDPFDSLPTTNVPRSRVQNLIRLFLSKIAFQYYPLDLKPGSNPFLVSWWPLALKDPALFNVSLQTASLDDEFHAKQGFFQSALLMKDCVSLLRQKIEDPALAFQDATLNAVVTLAAIEFGQGNVQVGEMHIGGVKRMVKVRGGISRIKKTSPLTARMVPWVSMLIMGSPQFSTQDDFGHGDGIGVISQWQHSAILVQSSTQLLDEPALDLDPALENILTRLRFIFQQSDIPDSPYGLPSLSNTDLHDLMCFILHKLLLLPPPEDTGPHTAILSQCVRYAASVYMFIINGPTYFPHVAILQYLVLQLKTHFISLILPLDVQDPTSVWLLSVGMVGSLGTVESTWFRDQASALSTALGLKSWEDTKIRLQRVLWLETGSGDLFRQVWEGILSPGSDISTSAPNSSLLPTV